MHISCAGELLLCYQWACILAAVVSCCGMLIPTFSIFGGKGGNEHTIPLCSLGLIEAHLYSHSQAMCVASVVEAVWKWGLTLKAGRSTCAGLWFCVWLMLGQRAATHCRNCCNSFSWGLPINLNWMYSCHFPKFSQNGNKCILIQKGVGNIGAFYIDNLDKENKHIRHYLALILMSFFERSK